VKYNYMTGMESPYSSLIKVKSHVHVLCMVSRTLKRFDKQSRLKAN